MNCNYYSAGRCRSCTMLGDPSKSKDLLYLKNFSVQHEPLVCVENPKHSRAKAKLSISGSRGDIIIGLVSREFKGIELENCPLHFKEINNLISEVKEALSNSGIIPYDIKKREGELKGLIINSSSTELMLRFVVRSKLEIKKLKDCSKILLKLNPKLKVVSVNVQPIPHQILEGEEEILLTKNSVIWEEFGEYKLAISPKSFTQVTPEIAYQLYLYVASIVKDIKPKVLLDLYCGVGGFATFCAKYADKTIGLEISGNAVDCARLSAKANKLDIEFRKCDVDKELISIDADLIICNPPRRGLSSSLIKSINSSKPQTIIYSSCNPETLLRDINILEENYKLESIKPFDMFPLTKHLEVVAVLRQR